MSVPLTSVADLKSQLAAIIKDNTFNIEQLKQILAPIASFVDSPAFIQNISGIVNIITKDRNGNEKFDVGDLKLLSEDLPSMISLASALLLVISSIPGIKIIYNKDETELLLLKLLLYIFLVIVPARVGRPLTLDEKNTIVDLSIVIYRTMQSSQMIQSLLEKIESYFKSKGWCKCCTAAQTTDDVVSAKLPEAEANLAKSITYVRTKKVAPIKTTKPNKPNKTKK